MKIEPHGGGTRLLSIEHCPTECAVSISDDQTSFSDQLAAATQSPYQGQVDEGPTTDLRDFDDLLDLPALAPLPPRFHPPVVRQGIDCPPSGVHVLRPATIEEIAAVPDLHERAVACLANNVKADTPEAKLVLESVRNEGPLGLFAHHGGMAPPPLPPPPKLKKRPVPKFPKYQLNDLFAPDAGLAAPLEAGRHE